MAITETECHRYATRRRRKGVTDGTVRTELHALRRAAAPERGLVGLAPKMDMPARPEARIRWLTREEANRLLAASKAHYLRLFVTPALHTGARSRAILGLTWDRVDLPRRGPSLPG